MGAYLALGVSVKTDLIQSKTYPLETSEMSEEHSDGSGFHEAMNEEADEEDKCSFDGNLNHSSNDESPTGSLNSGYDDLIILDESASKKGLTETEIKKFPTYTYLSSDKTANPDGCCSICISSFEVGEIIREIICGHEFHRDCIDKWLIASTKCPYCNKQLR